MLKHFKYLKYLLVHKWFVFIECCKVGMPIRGIIHDASKFFPDEWFPYVENFYGKRGDHSIMKKDLRLAYKKAWLLHQKRNKHHWQWWLLKYDTGNLEPLEMDYKTRKEMVCDWRGAGRAQGHGNDLLPWYHKNREKMILHPETRRALEVEIGYKAWRMKNVVR